MGKAFGAAGAAWILANFAGSILTRYSVLAKIRGKCGKFPPFVQIAVAEFLGFGDKDPRT
jgi:hypothetical protein